MTSPRPPLHATRISSTPSPAQSQPQSHYHHLPPTPPTTATTTTTTTTQPQHTITPFFTLISNQTNTTHKHPIVHYVFADDDFDPISAAAQSSADGAKERPVVVDMAADGESVLAAHSLSDDWQVVGVNVASAPQWMAGDEEASAGGGGGLMLTIRGMEGSSAVAGAAAGGGGAAAAAMVGAAVGIGGSGGGGGKESLYELAEMFHERMADIKNVIEYGEKPSAEAES